MFKTLPELFKFTADKYADKPSFLTRSETKENGQKVINFSGPTWKELYDRALNLAAGLVELGLKPKQHVGLLADNRVEWILCDYAILMNGAADVPRGTDITESEIEYILNHSDAVMTFVEHEAMLNKVLKIRDQLTNIGHIIVMDPAYSGGHDGVLTLQSVIDKGKAARDSGSRTVEENMSQIKPDDLFTIIYTSGTTGPPKGVQLMHSNMMHQVNVIPDLFSLNEKDKALSILPVWHVFERVFEYLFISRGCATYYTSVRTLGDDIKVAQPTVMGSAPRLWESIYQKILDNIEKQNKQTIFNIAVKISGGIGKNMRYLSGQDLQLKKAGIGRIFGTLSALIKVTLLFIPYLLIDAIVLKKFRAATGGKLRATVSGGGALPIHIDQFYNNIGIPVLEGYGMTETSPVIAVRTESRRVLGSVGPIIPDCEVQIRDENGNPLGPGQPGVIHVKGPQVMKGYYKNEEATKKVLVDGWMNTGDLGIWTYNKPPCIKITGRAKDTIVLFSGENVEPVPIENQISDSIYIAQNMVVGQDEKFLGALIYLEEETIVKWAGENSVDTTEFHALLNHDQVKGMIGKEIKRLVSGKTGFKSFERVIDFRIIPKPFEVGDEMTNLFKLKRHIITKKYEDLIKQIYDK